MIKACVLGAIIIGPWLPIGIVLITYPPSRAAEQKAIIYLQPLPQHDDARCTASVRPL